jgi:hypothetical protein
VDDFTHIALRLSFYEAATEGGEYPTEDCPECGDDMVVWFDPASGERSKRFARCFVCEAEFDDRCWRCNRPATAPSEDEGTVCSDCWSELAHKN